MPSNTVAQFANELKMPANALLERLRLAGINLKSSEDFITDIDKAKLLEALHQSSGLEKSKKITLTRRQTSEIHQSDSSGRSRTIQVEIRKKRTFVKRSLSGIAAEGSPSILEKESVTQESYCVDEAPDPRDTWFLKEPNRNPREFEKLVPMQKTTQPVGEKQASVVIENNPNTEINFSMEKIPQDKLTASPNTTQQGEFVPRSAPKPTPESNSCGKQRDQARRQVEAEAAALCQMLSHPRKILRAPESNTPKNTLLGTLHKPANKTGPIKVSKKNIKLTTPNTKKTVKTAELASTWSENNPRKKNTERQVVLNKDNYKGKKTPKPSRENHTQHSDHSRSNEPQDFISREIRVPETITVAELAHRLSVKAAEVIKQLIKLGQMATINEPLDQETAMIVVEEIGHTAIATKFDDPEAFLDVLPQNNSKLLPRAPVVTVVGHVDHGKTLLLDCIRRSKVAGNEAGGITQHIGAYHVQTEGGAITFLDTPGHEAFTAMRARGVEVTDIVVLVVAADDGVMPQTREAIQHSKAARVPVVVAINKIDRVNANYEKVKQELIAEQVIPEEYGGDVPFVPVSARDGTGIDNLLEQILLQSEILELKAPTDTSARGLVIESRLDKGRGPVATVLVKSGTLKKGDFILVGASSGRVRAMLDENGRQMHSAMPSVPVEIQGLTEVPNTGDNLIALSDERKAREIALFRQGKSRDVKLASQQISRPRPIFNDLQGDPEILCILVKTDVQGSREALVTALAALSTKAARVNIVYAGVGGISESDVNLAITSNALVIGFNVRADQSAKKLADANHINLKHYNIIYDAIDGVKTALSGILLPDKKEEVTGLVEIREVYSISRVGKIAGCMVVNGTISRDSQVRLLRGNIVCWSGQLDSLRRFKDDVKEVRSGFDCGLTLRGNNDICIGDRLEVLAVREVGRAL